MTFVGKRSRALDVDDWISAVILAPDDVIWDDSPSQAIMRLSKLFELAGELPKRFSSTQLKNGLWYLVGESGSGMPHELYNESVNLSERIGCVKAMHTVFFELFAKYCQDRLSNGMRDTPTDYEPLNSICYMWWDIFPSYGRPDKPGGKKIDEVILKLMQDTLTIKNKACIESALHGLGHWHLHYRSEVEQIIDLYLSKNKSLGGQLRDYALDAKCGRVL